MKAEDVSDRALLNFLVGKALVHDEKMDLVGKLEESIQYYREEYARLYNEIMRAEEKL